MNKKLDLKAMTLIALMTAVCCILSPFSISIGISPVPITLGTFTIYLLLLILGLKKGLISVLLYLLIGLVGLPVFSGFSGGAGKLFGPTGGYLVGYIFLAIIAGFFIDKWANKWYLCFPGMILGTAALYLFGTVWLAFQQKLSFYAALWAAVIPYIPVDLIKMALAVAIGIPVRKALRRAGLLSI